MKNKTSFVILALVFVLLIGGAYALYNGLSKNAQSNPLLAQSSQSASSGSSSDSADSSGNESSGSSSQSELTPAPDFTVYDKEGNEVHLSDYIGKPIVLNFWASWCGPCKSEMPDFNQAYLTHGEQVQFLMINMTDGSKETVDSAWAFIEEQGYEFPVFYDTSYNAAMAYGAYALPTTYFIDAQGYAVAYAQGPLNGENLQKGLDMILSQA